MNVERRIRRWAEEKLIDQSQAEKLLAYEREHGSASWILYGLCGIGVVVLACGLISIFAANWFAIPAASKLLTYFVVLGLLGFAAAKYSERPGAVRESLLTAFGLFVLAGIGLIGQTYHLEGDGYRALFFWLAIILPITLNARSRLLNTIWVVGLEITICIWVFSDASDYTRVMAGIAVPYILIAIGYAGSRFLPVYFTDASRFWGYITLFVPFAVIGNIGWAEGAFTAPDHPIAGWAAVPYAAAAIAAAAVLTRNFQRGSILTAAMLLTILASLFLFVVPATQDVGRHEIVGCFLFILLWCGAAVLAAASERKRLFDFAAFIIGLRFIVIYFEVFGSLAATGAGLILSGAVILGIAYLWHRYRGKVAKAIRGQA